MSCASKSGPKSALPFWLVYSAFSDLCYRILNMPEPIDLVHFEVCSSEPTLEASYVGSVFYNVIAWTFQLKEALISTTWDVLDNSYSPCSFHLGPTFLVNPQDSCLFLLSLSVSLLVYSLCSSCFQPGFKCRNMYFFVTYCRRILILLLLCHCFFFNFLTFSFYLSKELNSEADAQANLAVNLAGEALKNYIAFFGFQSYSINFIDFCVTCLLLQMVKSRRIWKSNQFMVGFWICLFCFVLQKMSYTLTSLCYSLG